MKMRIPSLCLERKYALLNYQINILAMTKYSSMRQIILEFGPKPVKAEAKVENKLLKVSITRVIFLTLGRPLIHSLLEAWCQR